jgi:hypothetical protein
MTPEPDHLHQPVLAVARKDVATLRQDFTVKQMLWGDRAIAGS